MKSKLPKELQQLIDTEAMKFAMAGIDADEAESQAYRAAAHAGWFETVDGWQRLGPDVREKINVRKAERQPDGRYLVRDVDVFYPNAVKQSSDGQPITYSARDIESIISNTNRAIESGGQRPAVTMMHPNAMQAATGTVIPQFGCAINFRASSRGEGWARCDLIDLDPQIVRDWKTRRITGLSAGFVQDGGELNRRFGHVAALGAQSQALAALPITEVFSAGESLCFSAEAPVTHFEGVHTMDRNRAVKAQPLLQALAIAAAALAAGEPGAEAKFAEAKNNYNTEFGTELPLPEGSGGGVSGGSGEFTTDVNRADDGNLSFAADPEAAFNALNSKVDTLVSSNRKLTILNAALQGKMARDEFSAQLKDLAAEGYQFDSAAAMQQFEASAGNKPLIAGIINLIKSSPKKTAPSQQPVVFGANSAGQEAVTEDTDFAAVAADMSKTMGRNYTVEEVKLYWNISPGSKK